MSATETRVNGHDQPLKLVKVEQADGRMVHQLPEEPVKARPRRRPVRATIRGLRGAVTHERTRKVVRGAARHGLFVVGGTRIVWRRGWDGRTPARYERMMRTCEAAGRHEEAKEWEDRGQRFREARHQRRMELLRAPEQVAKSALNTAAVGGAGLLALGVALAVATEDVRQMAAPWLWLVEAVRWAVLIAGLVWGVAVWVVPPGVLLALWDVGRKQQAAPQWTMPPAQRERDDEPITPHLVVLALRHLGISALRKAILAMEDGAAAMLGQITPAGCGVEVDVHLPLEVTTEEIQDKRKKLAENLRRHEHEVHITIPPAARTVRLWIADAGALDEPVGPSPLVTDPDMTADYKSGRAPWGVDLRGDSVLMSLYQKMVLVTGLSNQGKTASLRALALWLALDPTVEFRIGDLKGIGDWRMFLGLATILIEGPTDDHVIAVTEMVEDVFDEMNRRLQAPKGSVFTPLVCIVDEAQVAYGSGARETYVSDNGTVKYGAPYGGAKNTSRYFRAVKGIHDQGRAVNVTIWEGTQDPTNENLPKRSREGNHIRASLVVGTEAQAKMALGETPVEKGAAPHKLRQGFDKGQLVAAGEGVPLAPGQVSLNVRTHFIDIDDAAEIAERAKVRRSPVATSSGDEPAEERDHLADILRVLGTEARVLTVEVANRLAALDASYTGWDAARVKAVLVEAGTDTKKSSRSWVIREWVAEAIRQRDESTD